MKLGSIIAAVGAVMHVHAASADDALREQAARALLRGATFFRQEVAVQGTCLWQYSDDLKKREGEGKATATQGWVQPPGTPSVGMAYLAAWRATSNQFFLEAARETALGLLGGQLRSGGWHYSVEFDPEARRKIGYRDGGGAGRVRNVTTFDDDTTQSALRFLVSTDAALSFKDRRIEEAIQYALTAIFKAQYPNGAWPQGYEEFPEPDAFPVRRASYPENWSRTWPGSEKYWRRYTLNDNALATLVETLLDIERTYSDTRAGKQRRELAVGARAAALKGGDFLLLAQMPEPQPAWAQQYDFEMHPAWARKFEPPAVSGGESQRAMRLLLMLYRETGERKYLEPVPRALAYLRSSRLPDGRLARFYELRSNRPLYFTRDYQLTHDDRDVPTHYAFKISDDTPAITREYERLRNVPADQLRQQRMPPRPRLTESLAAEVRGIIAAQDARGRWIENGRLRYHGAEDDTRRIIRSATFSRNMETLSRYLELERLP